MQLILAGFMFIVRLIVAVVLMFIAVLIFLVCVDNVSGYYRHFKYVKQWAGSSKTIASDVGKIQLIVPSVGPNGTQCSEVIEGCYAVLTLKVFGKEGIGTLSVPSARLTTGNEAVSQEPTLTMHNVKWSFEGKEQTLEKIYW